MTTWSEGEFRARLYARAAELGNSPRQLCIAAGIAHDALDRVPVQGRRIDSIEKLARAFRISLAEAMGFAEGPVQISKALVEMADASAHNLLNRLPRSAPEAKTWANLFVHFYELYAAAMADGRLTHETLENVQTTTEEALFSAWREPDAVRQERVSDGSGG